MSNKLGRAMKFVIFITLTLSVFNVWSIELPAKLLPEEKGDLYIKFCNGQFESFMEEIEKIKPNDERYLASRSMLLYTKQGQLMIRQYVKSLPQDVDLISEDDRLMAAAYLVNAQSSDFQKIRQLLDFRPSSKIRENSRMVMESYLDEIQGNNSLALKKKIDAFIAYPEVGLLTEIFLLATYDRSAERILSQFMKYLDQISDKDPSKYLMLASMQVATSGYKEMNKIFDYIKKGYSLCKYDPRIALQYASLLISKNEIDEAESVLVEQVNSNVYYSAYIDFYLSQIYFIRGNLERANFYKDRAIENRVYFSDSMKRQVDALGKSDSKDDNKFYIIILVIFAFVALGSLFFYKRFK